TIEWDRLYRKSNFRRSMMLQKSMKLINLLDKDDYATFVVEAQKLTTEEQNCLVSDLIVILGGKLTDDSFSSDTSSDLERALEVVLTMSTPEFRLRPMVDQAIASQFDNLTRILLEALAEDFKTLDQNFQEWVRWDVVAKADREMMKELDEEEEDNATLSISSHDHRLKSWLSFCDSIQSTFCMRGSVIIRSYRSSWNEFLEWILVVDPLSPSLIPHSIPFVLSPNYAVSTLGDRLVHYISRKNTLKRRDYVRIVVNSIEYLGGLLRNEEIVIVLPQMERLLVALLPILNDYDMGDERKKSVFAFRSLLLSFPLRYQPLLLKRIVRIIKDQMVKVDAEAQILSFLVDLYRQQLVVRGKVDEEYSSCLPEFWAVIYIKYDDCSQASMFYQSLFLLAGLQARMNHGLPLLKDVQVRVLTPLQQQLSDYLQLRKLQDKSDRERANIDLSFLPTVEDDSVVRLHISLRVMKETFQLIHQALTRKPPNN
ncbi:hypothetical protein PENTCL1PPCAC_22864, partial [Pristionchus entomophagus]